MVALSQRTVPWWNKELSRFKASTRWIFNKAKRTGNLESYKTALTFYNKEIRKAKRSSWRDYCQGIKDVPDRARLTRIMASQPTGWNLLLDGRYDLEKEPGGAIHSHFPGSAGEEVTLEGQGQPNLRAFAAQGRTGNCLKRSLISLK
jgi:hypothetical protein